MITFQIMETSMLKQEDTEKIGQNLYNGKTELCPFCKSEVLHLRSLEKAIGQSVPPFAIDCPRCGTLGHYQIAK